MKKKIFIAIIILSICAFLGYIVFNKNNNSNSVSNGSSQKLPPIAKNMTALIKTNYGEIKLELYFNLAPNTTANFVKLAEAGFYDGTKFHRVIKDFMIQSGDPLTKDDSKKNLWGTGGPGYAFDDEIHYENNNTAGTIAMANSGPNTNGSQFFINTADNYYLDKKHTVFGKVTEGMDIVRAIENVAVDNSDRPVEDVIVESIEIIK